MSYNVVVLASGAGSLFQSLLLHQTNYRISALITDTPKALAIEIAKANKVSVEVCDVKAFTTRLQWNEALLKCIETYSPDLVVSAGFMKILGESVIEAFSGRLINIHPSLLPAFPGAHAVRDALLSGATITGTTVHYVDAGIDTGNIITQREVEIVSGDSVQTLHERIKVVERSLIVEVVESFAKGAVQ